MFAAEHATYVDPEALPGRTGGGERRDKGVGVDLETILTAATLVVTVAIWLFDRYYVRRRRLSYRVHWNSRVLTSPGDKNMKIDLEILHRSQSVPEASFVMLRIQNVGSSTSTPRTSGARSASTSPAARSSTSRSMPRNSAPWTRPT